MEELLQAPTDGVGDAIIVPPILANQFELKIGLLNLVTAIAFLGAARTWLEKEPPNSITTWNDHVSKFLNRFFPPSKTTNLRNKITRFQQRFGETFAEAWDRFKYLLNKCPHHGFSPLRQIHIFYYSLSQYDQDSLNSAAGGNFLTKNTQEALTIIENKSKVQTSRNKPQVISASGSLTQDAHITSLTKQVEALLSLDRPINSIQNGCETCGGPHHYYDCQAAGGYTHDVYATSGTYNEGGNTYQPQADSGASINLMPLSIYEKLRIGPLKPTQMTLELANRSVTFPMGIAKDVIVKVEKFNFLADFIIVDFEADPRVSIILGRPFLRTARALVDLYEEKLTLRVGNEEVVFYTDKSSRNNSRNIHSVHCINIIDFSKDKTISGNPTPSDSMVESSYPSPIPYGDSDSLLEETDTLLSYFNNSSPDYETFCFDIEEKSSGSTTTHSDYSLLDYDAFYFDDDHIEEKSSGSTTTYPDFSLPEYDLFIFDLSIDPFPPIDRSAFYHEEFANELAHIISPPKYDYFYFYLEADPGEFTRVLKENIFDLSTKGLIINELNDSSLLLSNCDSSLSKEFSKIDLLVSFPSRNEDIIFDPGIFIIKGVQSKRFHILPLDVFLLSHLSVILFFLLILLRLKLFYHFLLEMRTKFSILGSPLSMEFSLLQEKLHIF
ncbi:reverse transcriptase domain-containing protein [Tanacetum coccineum]